MDMLPELYERNGFEPLWQNPRNVEDLMDEIGAIRADGLNEEFGIWQRKAFM